MVMPSRIFHRQRMAVLGAIVLAGSFLIAHVAYAQSDGDERCGKKGTAMMFDALAKSWAETGQPCTPPGPGGPVNHERRCGFAGYVLRYVAKTGAWESTQEHCDGSKPYIGWHHY
jgi:hypothetical protein